MIKILLLLLISTSSFAQQSKVELLYSKKIKCEPDSDSGFSVRNRIIDQFVENDVLHLKLGKWLNCSDSFKTSVDLKHWTLNLKIDVAPGANEYECSCFTYFQFRVKVNGAYIESIYLNDKLIEFSNERYKLFPVRYDITNSDTINRVDKYGLRQGKWYFENAKNRYFVYLDGKCVRRVMEYPNGKIRNEWIVKEKVEKEIDGKKVRQFEDVDIFREWDEKGKLIYEGKNK